MATAFLDKVLLAVARLVDSFVEFTIRNYRPIANIFPSNHSDWEQVLQTYGIKNGGWYTSLNFQQEGSLYSLELLYVS